MELKEKKPEAAYLIVSSGETIKLHFGKGCCDSMVYDDTAAIRRLRDLNPAFYYGLHLLKKEQGVRYQFFPESGRFVKVDCFKIN